MCSSFEPSGYQMQDKCKNCGHWTATVEGLKELGRQAQVRGSTRGAIFQRCEEERWKAVRHGVIGENDFLIEDLRSLVLQYAQAQHKSSTSAMSSDIGVDQDTSREDEKRGSVKQTKGQQVKVKDVEALEIGDLVFYGAKSNTSKSKRRVGRVLKKNVIVNSLVKGKDVKPAPGQKPAMSSVQLEDLQSGREQWVYMNCLWSDRVVERKTQWTNLDFLATKKDFTLEEAFVDFPGNHQ